MADCVLGVLVAVNLQYIEFTHFRVLEASHISIVRRLKDLAIDGYRLSAISPTCESVAFGFFLNKHQKILNETLELS